MKTSDSSLPNSALPNKTSDVNSAGQNFPVFVEPVSGEHAAKTISLNAGLSEQGLSEQGLSKVVPASPWPEFWHKIRALAAELDQHELDQQKLAELQK